MDASKLLSEYKFWEIIEKSEKGTKLPGLLSALSDDELIGFNYWWTYFANKLYRQDLWAAAYIVRGGCSDDSFEYFRYWLITQGRKIVYDALADADSLCDVFKPEEEPENEEANYTIIEEIEKREAENAKFSEKFNEREILAFPDIEFEWEEDDDESIRAVCPRTFDRYGDNPLYLPDFSQFAGTHSATLQDKPASKGFFAKLLRFFTGRR